MKATGIVRRIDDLGRVVIPKEIRRTLHIRVGEPLEIYVSGAGEIIFKKYSPLGELSSFATRYAEVLSRAVSGAVLVTDRDHILAASGASRKEFLDQSLSPGYEQAMEERRLQVLGEDCNLFPFPGAPLPVSVLAPILSHGDIVGSVALLGGEPGETETRLLGVAAAFLGRQMEE